MKRPEGALEPWERQQGEPTKAFAAFALYRDMGAERSIEKVARLMGGLPVNGRGRTPGGRWLERLSPRWNWRDRAAAWDAEVDRRARDAYAQRVIDARERHARMAAGALAALSAPIYAAVASLRSSNAVDALTQAATADPRSLIALLDTVARHSYAISALIAVERMALGMSTEYVEVDERRESSPLLLAMDSDPEIADLAIRLVNRATNQNRELTTMSRTSTVKGE